MWTYVFDPRSFRPFVAKSVPPQIKTVPFSSLRIDHGDPNLLTGWRISPLPPSTGAAGVFAIVGMIYSSASGMYPKLQYFITPVKRLNAFEMQGRVSDIQARSWSERTDICMVACDRV